MTIHFIIILIIIILFALFIVYSTTYNKFQDYIIKINEVESKIDDSLREKFDIILKLNNIIKEIIKPNFINLTTCKSKFFILSDKISIVMGLMTILFVRRCNHG